ncbi:MAG: response regulator transcription factor [Laribacter sp.]|jgi:two-component system response regulator FixJ|nr:response regulator transcription factor [Laribacter sp.]MBP9527449.1 response regulator transcription factor [Laribacter sp.]MBP9608104.1 response regulator transcription factor [Laribacter sp.]
MSHPMPPRQQLDPTVYVVDDDPAVLDSVVLLLRSHGITAQPFDSARHFLQTYQPGQIACLVLDLRMPGMGGLELQHELAAADFDIPIIFLTGHGDVQQCSHAFRAGAIDFLTKPIDELALVSSVRHAVQESIRRHTKQAQTREVEERLTRLSKRELEIVRYIVDGMSSREIAHLLELSPRTVEAHRANIYDKLEVVTLADLVRLYLTALSDRKLAERLNAMASA